MFIRNKKINLLNKSIENLNKILQEGNFIELTKRIKINKKSTLEIRWIFYVYKK